MDSDVKTEGSTDEANGHTPEYTPPIVPPEIASNIIKLLRRVDLKGDEAFGYVQASVFLKDQLKLHQKLQESHS